MDRKAPSSSMSASALHMSPIPRTHLREMTTSLMGSGKACAAPAAVAVGTASEISRLRDTGIAQLPQVEFLPHDLINLLHPKRMETLLANKALQSVNS